MPRSIFTPRNGRATVFGDRHPGHARRTVRTFLLLILALPTVGCQRDRRYPLVGQIIAVNAARQELTVKHHDIRGFMPGMTMPFRIKDPAQVTASKAGDLITATLVVAESMGYLEDVTRTGEAPLPADIPKGLPAPMIDPGSDVPAAEFIDQNGRDRSLAEWRGRTLAVTFVYTRCPLPDFCPLMDRHFAAVQKLLDADAALAARVHLLSVSFDPDYDTPAVLKAHATRARADPTHWSYLTGSRDRIDAFAAAFGVAIMRGDDRMAEIVHNLRTAVIDRNGRLVKILNGNDWQPEQLMAELRAADGRR